MKSITPRRPFTGPAGLVKSRPGMVSRPELAPSASARQSMRPLKAAEPVAGEPTNSARGLRSEG